jgi:prephenate dehydrogenase
MGLMGGSLAWAIKDQVASLMAADPDSHTRDQVRSAGLVESIVENPEEILPLSDVVILAAPVGTILELIPQIPDWHPGQAMVLDLGSTKEQICHQLEKLPSRFDVLGGHPICGQVQGGFEHANPDLFRDAIFAFSDLSNTSARCRKFGEDLAAAIGAIPSWIDPAQHDYYLSATSHLPYILSAALCLNTPEGSTSYRGPGFESSSRLASTNKRMMFDVLNTNRQNILQQMEQFQHILEEFKDLLQQENNPELMALMDRAAAIKNETTREVL